MKPLCPDCGTEHQPEDHPRDQRPDAQERKGEERLIAIRRGILAEMMVSDAETAVDRLIAHTTTVTRTQEQDQELKRIRAFLADFRISFMKAGFKAEEQILNLIEKGLNHE